MMQVFSATREASIRGQNHHERDDAHHIQRRVEERRLEAAVGEHVDVVSKADERTGLEQGGIGEGEPDRIEEREQEKVQIHRIGGSTNSQGTMRPLLFGPSPAWREGLSRASLISLRFAIN